jgi:TPR repeat protein
MKRLQANDPPAIRKLGGSYYQKGDYRSAAEYFTKAAELGDVESHQLLSVAYHKGQGVEKDEKKELYHLEVAAIGGHPHARHNLGAYEARCNRMERAVKHMIIAANLGSDDSIKALKQGYIHGFISKDDFAAALRAHQAAIDATKSPQREEAARAEAAGEIR